MRVVASFGLNDHSNLNQVSNRFHTDIYSVCVSQPVTVTETLRHVRKNGLNSLLVL